MRVSHGEENKLARGDEVQAIGVLQGSVTTGGRTVPDVEASLVLTKGSKSGKKAGGAK